MGLSFTALQLAGLLAAAVAVYFRGWHLSLGTTPTAPSHFWWLRYGAGQPGSTGLLWDLVGLFILLLICFIAGIVFRGLYNRTASAEVFFMIFFLCSFALEATRVWNGLLLLEGLPTTFSVIGTRVIYFGRIFGLICLLFASLYAIEIRFQRLGVLLLSSIFLSLAFAYVLPVDSSVVLSNYLYRLGDERSTSFFVLVLQIAACLNFVIAGLKRQHWAFPLAALAVLLMLIGRELLLFQITPFSLAAGELALVAGLWLFSMQMRRVYLWP